MNVTQSLKFSALSSVRVDGCTSAPELGVTIYCKMHDHLLIHLASKTHVMNERQIDYLQDNFLPMAMTRKQADIIFRDGLAEKVESTDGLRKLGYWLVKWIYYTFVRVRSVVIQ